jgi:hypothetical protein
VSDASNNRQGGVALRWKEHDSYELEEWRFFGPNVLAFRLVTVGKDFYCVGCYIPPSEDVRRAQQQCPEKFELLLFGDLNIDLDAPRDTREEIIAEQCDYWKLTCMTTMFKQRRTRRVKGRWTWRQQRLGRWVSTKPNYFLADTAVRRLFKKVVIRRPRHHDSDHRAIIATFWGGQEKRLRSYQRRVASIPLRMPQFGPLSEMETIFEEMKEEVDGTSKRDLPHNQWISDRTWALVDHRAMLKTWGSLQQRGGRNLSRRINASFQQDRMARAENAATEIEAQLNGGISREDGLLPSGGIVQLLTEARSRALRLWRHKPQKGWNCMGNWNLRGSQFQSMCSPLVYVKELQTTTRYGIPFQFVGEVWF